MITNDNFKKLREEVKVAAIINNKQKYIKNKYLYMPIENVSSHQKDRINRESLSCALNLFYYYCKYNGERSVDKCIPNYSKGSLSDLINSFNMNVDYDNIQNLHNQKGKIKIGHNRNKILSSYCSDQEIAIFVLKLVKKYIANNKTQLISEYNNFCNWVANSESVNNYLKGLERVV